MKNVENPLKKVPILGKTNKHVCSNCGKSYKDRSGLWHHKKKCKAQESSNIENQKLKEELKAMKEEMKNLKNMQQHVTNNIPVSYTHLRAHET